MKLLLFAGMTRSAGHLIDKDRLGESGKAAKEDARFEMIKSCLAVAGLIKRSRCLKT